ncbi:low molecular weight phosphatase family protein [Planctomonas sp. JC2975]|uniref:arsenate reductase/protein-tyrosine-phosphatase family protein n=1 Tax=Planctomonas sp. JC2975 TaxID=2729626 RepID=UPI001475E15E|nr:low molecular weight phosphatase family protein [Planctomonas sp. JC2975]NNC12952.1 low molecular weight phosphatase family protein [Planctomonas sp. JC2975]
MTDPIRPFRVLFVCAGNTCRSPMAAQLLRARLGVAAGFAVESAGILAEVGSPMTSDARAAIVGRVAVVAPHRARQLTVPMVEAADLVLAATRQIRADTVRSVPAAVRRTFTILEFARLAQRMPADAAIALDEVVASVAAERTGAADADDDIDDPMGHAASEYKRVAGVLDDAATVIARLLVSAARPRLAAAPDVVAPPVPAGD